nr:MAG TPA: hypothetical protein [Caudoviricetes sp.]
MLLYIGILGIILLSVIIFLLLYSVYLYHAISYILLC